MRKNFPSFDWSGVFIKVSYMREFRFNNKQMATLFSKCIYLYSPQFFTFPLGEMKYVPREDIFYRQPLYFFTILSGFLFFFPFRRRGSRSKEGPRVKMLLDYLVLFG